MTGRSAKRGRGKRKGQALPKRTPRDLSQPVEALTWEIGDDEAQLLARVEHPNVARVYGVERHEGRIGIWMELIEGVDLQSLLREGGPLDLAPRVSVAAEILVLAGLAAALQQRRGFGPADYGARHPAGELGKRARERQER